MSEMQRMLDGTIVPTTYHRDDIIICEDGTQCRYEEALEDCKGGFHSTEESCDEANIGYVHEAINNACKWAEEYTEHDDYGNAYAYVAWESLTGSDLRDRVKGWLEDNDFDETLIEWIVPKIVDKLDEGSFEAEHDRNDYRAYAGDGMWLYSLEVGECEEQLDISNIPYVPEYIIERACSVYRGDAYIHCHQRRNKCNDGWEDDGYIKGNCITFYTSPGGQWHYYYPAEYIKDIIRDIFNTIIDEVD